MQRIVACLPLLSACTIITSPTQPSGDVVTDGSESSTSTADTTTDAHDESTSGQVSSGDESSSTPADESSDGGETESSADETGTTPPGEILFAADFDDVRFPEYGFSSERVTAGHSMRTAVPSAGPHGEDVCDYELVASDEMLQPYFGWSVVDLPMTEPGEIRYIRLLFRIHSPCDGIGLFDVWTDKFIILGDGLPDPWGNLARVIITLGDPIDNTLRTSIMRNIDGAEHGIDAIALECGEWHWLQWEVRSSSTIDASDGGFRVWLDGDNANYDDATGVSSNFPLVSWVEEEQANAWNNLNLGFFGNTSLGSGSIGFDFAAFEYGTAFDPSWHD